MKYIYIYILGWELTVFASVSRAWNASIWCIGWWLGKLVCFLMAAASHSSSDAAGIAYINRECHIYIYITKKINK